MASSTFRHHSPVILLTKQPAAEGTRVGGGGGHLCTSPSGCLPHYPSATDPLVCTARRSMAQPAWTCLCNSQPQLAALAQEQQGGAVQAALSSHTRVELVPGSLRAEQPRRQGTLVCKRPKRAGCWQHAGEHGGRGASLAHGDMLAPANLHVGNTGQQECRLGPGALMLLAWGMGHGAGRLGSRGP